MSADNSDAGKHMWEALCRFDLEWFWRPKPWWLPFDRWEALATVHGKRVRTYRHELIILSWLTAPKGHELKERGIMRMESIVSGESGGAAKLKKIAKALAFVEERRAAKLPKKATVAANLLYAWCQLAPPFPTREELYDRADPKKKERNNYPPYVKALGLPLRED